MTRNLRGFVAFVVVAALGLGVAEAQRKKKKTPEEERTQVLALPKDPPLAVTVETGRLGYYVTPLSAKGLLSQQVRDGLKHFFGLPGRPALSHIRAFVAGSGDLRRVQQIVSEEFTEKNLPLPAVTTIQVGLLPLEGAQVVLEATAQEKRAVNPRGIALVSGQQIVARPPAQNSLQPVMPLVETSLANLKIAHDAAGVTAANVLRATCFLTSLADYGAVSARVASAFPKAAINIVQVQRAPGESLVECETVGRLETAPGAASKFLNPEGIAPSPNYSQVVLVGAPKLVITGTQLAFGREETDARLAFERLGRVLDGQRSSYRNVVMMMGYPLTYGARDRVRAVRFNFLDKARPPASTMLLFEGLPSLDAPFAVEVIATAN